MNGRPGVHASRVVAVLGVLGLVTVGMVASPAAADDPCGPTGNAIVCENSKPGTDPSVWDIDGAGDDGIQGFSTDISVDVGGTIGFKIDTAASAYTIDIYRTGWYGGLGARKIASVTPSATLPQHQPQCTSDVTTELYDCGSWALSASWTVPTTAVSGVYIAHLKVPATGAESHITFVVRDDSSASDIIFQTSDPTWQAYNQYGGSDFYQGAANGRAYKISYNRPVVTRGLVQGRDFYFSSEYAMVRFLERNGYDVSYQSGVDTDRFGAHLLNHKVFLSVGHDEYWSGAQRANVEAARDAGVNLAFFSGNEVYWRTRYEPSAAGTATPYRTLVSYKETWSNDKIDPAAEWTGTWRDPRFSSTANGGGLPENGLTGTLYQSNFSDLPVTVSAAEGKLRLWRGTSLAQLATGASAQLAPHTIGYESDEDLDNGARPPGLIRLSTTVGAVPEYLQDFGNVVAAGTTTHHLTMYRAASGALVFGAGTVQWAWGLDAEHDGDGAAADPRMQQATVNLLADMHAQPRSLMAGLVAATASTDTAGPTVSITSPAQNATIANGTKVTLTGTASDTGGGRVAGVEVSTDGGATWHPATGTTSWSYQYVQPGTGPTSVRVRAVDDSANIGAAAQRQVTVSCPCTLFGQSVPATPAANDSSAVELGLRFAPTVDGFVTGVRFYKGTGNTGTHTGTLWSATGTPLATVTFANETATGWQTATFSSAVPVTAGTTYVASYTAPAGHYAVQSDAFWSRGIEAPPLRVAGGFGAAPAGVYAGPGAFPDESYRSSHYFVDAVFSTVDSTPLTVRADVPLAGSSSVAVTTPVSAVFSKPATNVTATLRVGGTAVAGTTSYSSTSRTVTFTPTSPLARDTTFTFTVGGKDAQGAAVSGTTSWTFRTAAAPQVAGARTVSLYDEDATPTLLQDVDTVPVTLGVRFSSSVAGTVSAVRFYKGPNNTGTHVGALWAVGSSTPLATVTFTNESSQGWQKATFSTPVRISKDVEYVASYRTTVGRYSATVGAFSGTGVQRAPLRTTADSGAYSYADAYPNGSSSTSYLVDVVFTADATSLAVVSQAPAAGAPGASPTAPVSITLSAPVTQAASLTLSRSGTAVAGSTTRSSDGTTLTFTPGAALQAGTTYTATASGLVSTDGSTLATQTWSFQTAAAQGCPCTLFGTQTPASTSVNDSDSVELGVAFTPTQSGVVTGVRFWKGAGNGGTHVGSLWSASGDRLRQVTFTGETASGWQTATLAAPLEVDPGTTYVVSYLAPQGHYAATGQAFTAPTTVGPLTVPAVGNGRYRYGGGFPTDTWQQTNYFVDVVFSIAAPSPATVIAQAPGAGTSGISTSAGVAATLSKVPPTGEPTLALAVAGAAVAGTSEWDPATRQVTFTPTAPLPAGAAVAAAVTLGGTAVEGGSWTFTTAAAQVPGVSFWTDAQAPSVAAWNDPVAVQVGTRFTTSVAGTVTAVRFYKGATNTGTHTVKLWGSGQTLLAEAVSTNESASGWQTVPLPQPVAVQPGVTYVAAYHTTSGRYAVTADGLASVRTAGPLSTVADGGAYVYGTGYPGSSSSASYGVDLVFVPAG